jgi:hypothetical protein
MSHELSNHIFFSDIPNTGLSHFILPPRGYIQFLGATKVLRCDSYIYIHLFIYLFISYFLVRSSDYINYWIINEWYIEKNVAETNRGTFKSTF